MVVNVVSSPYIKANKYQLVFTDVKPMSMIIDDTTTTDITYFCYASPGTLTSEAKWKIKILDETGGYPIIKWADGNSDFDNIADDRASLTYE